MAKIKNEQLAVNLISNFVAFGINAGLTFFLTPYIVGKVGSEAYGFIALAFLMVNYVTIFTAALNSMADRFISIEVNSNNNEKASIYFNSIFKADIIIALALILPFIFILFYIDKIFNVPIEMIGDVRFTFCFVFVSIVIALAGSVFGTAFFCKNRLELSSLRNTIGNVIKLVLTTLLFVLFAPKIYYITLIAAIVTLYSVLVNIYYTRKLLPEIKISSKYYSGSAVKTLIGSGIWNSLNQLSSALLNGLDLVIANIFIGSYMAGQYSLAKTIPTFAITFIVSIVAVFAPQFVILYAQSKRTELIDSVKLSVKILGVIVGIPLSFLIIFGDVFFALWLPGEDAGILFLLSNLTLIPMAIASSVEPLSYIYTVTNKLKIPTLILLVAGAVNTIGVLILLRVTSLGIYAIPLIAFIINMLWNLVFNPLYAAHCLKVKWHTFYPPIIKANICAVIMVIICLIVKPLLLINAWPELLATAFICGIGALSVSIFIAFNKTERDEIMKLFNKLVSYMNARSTSVKYTFEILSYSTYSSTVKRILFPFILLNVIVRRIMRCNDIYKLDFVVTTRCSLKCKHCSNLMQYYGSDTVMAEDYSTESISGDINKLAGLSDRIWQIIIVGGEAFMNKDLPEILSTLIPIKKIKQITIITNGTIIPNERLTAIMKHRKIQVSISDYGEVAKNKDKLFETLCENNIKCKILESMEWVDRGEIKKRRRTALELTDAFSACISKCTTLMNGKIYNCEIYSNGVNLGFIDELDDEVIDIRSVTKKEFSKQLKTLNTRKFIHACDYCGEVNYNENNTVKAGIQL